MASVEGWNDFSWYTEVKKRFLQNVKFCRSYPSHPYFFEFFFWGRSLIFLKFLMSYYAYLGDFRYSRDALPIGRLTTVISKISQIQRNFESRYSWQKESFCWKNQVHILEITLSLSVFEIFHWFSGFYRFIDFLDLFSKLWLVGLKKRWKTVPLLSKKNLIRQSSV